jgi:RHS repeat-associated protein
MKKYLSLLFLLLLSSVNMMAQTLSNENFIYTAVPQRAVQATNYNTLTPSEVNQSVTYFDGLGRPMQSIAIGQGANKVNNSILDWINTWSIGSGSVFSFNQNGDTGENVRINGIGPFDKNTILWQCVNDAASDADGGWNSSTITIDKTASYRYAVWVKRTGSQNGITYHGTQNVVNLDGTTNGNPYFWHGNLPALDQWYLMVGMIHPASYTGGYSGISGVYDTTGNKVISGTDFKWSSTTTDTYFRSYLYYATDTNTSQYFYNPTVQKLDGTEASVVGLSADFDASNIVTHMEYDPFGRQVKDYLPYAAPYLRDAYLKTSALAETKAFYNTIKYENTTNPFSQKELEASPLNRILQQAAPGNPWALASNKTIKMDYQTNTTAEVKLYTVALSFINTTYIPTLSLSTADSGFYAANELYKTITKGENWTSGKNNTSEEFKDKEGRIILKRTYSNYKDINGTATGTEVLHDTYYIYDLYGNLAYVLPPKAEGLTDITTLNSLCYQYIYDTRNRLVEKKLPGKEWEYIVYDKLDRPILTQDAILRIQNKWLFTKYDAYNRPIYTGDYVNTTAGETTREQMQGLTNASTTLSETKQGTNSINGTIIFYSNNAFPNINNTNINLFTINYYDDYNFDKDALTIPSTAYGKEIVNYNDSNKILTKGLATGSKIRVLGTANWTTTLIGYDVKGRSIYSISKNNYLTTTNTLMSQLDFTGKTLETTSTHLKNNITTTVVDVFSYDHAGRLLNQKQTINNQNQEVIAANTYDDLGQLTSKSVGGKTTQNRLQKVDFNYNIRGWLKNINDVNTIGNDLFAFQINYNDITDVSKKLYNGNISQTLWKTANTDSSLKSYVYSYDALNRLTDATDNLNKFNESLSYDKNGNIANLKRLGEIVGGVPSIANPSDFGTMDNLVYTYDNSNKGNRLMKVVDSSLITEGFKDGTNSTDDYSYDTNGNMTKDFNKGIGNGATDGITYNHLNLPTEVKFNNDNNNKINYIYDATGTKQKKIVTQSGAITETSYTSGYIYEKLPFGIDTMKFFSQAEGYVEPNGSSFKYVYQYKDHLGNTRLSYKDISITASSILQIEEENNYYPFGLKHKGYNIATPSTNTALKYKYNGKELQDELGLNLYDYVARNYDPAIGRFMNMDPLAETTRRFSPYTYALDNPVYFIDPDGMQATYNWEEHNKGNKGVYTDGNKNVSFETALSQANGNGGDSGPGDPPKGGKKPDEIVTIRGNKYHKNTNNLFASIGNKINSLFGGDSNYFVEHKPYDPVEENMLNETVNTGVGFVAGGYVAKGVGQLGGALISRMGAQAGMSTVGRWMSLAEYETMQATGSMVEGAGGQTFVSTGGPASFAAAAKGSVYVEFQVASNSLLKGGVEGWYKTIGPNAGRAMQSQLAKQGGQIMPTIQKLSPILQAK